MVKLLPLNLGELTLSLPVTAVGASLEILVYSELQFLDCHSFCCLFDLHFYLLLVIL